MHLGGATFFPMETMTLKMWRPVKKNLCLRRKQQMRGKQKVPGLGMREQRHG